MERIGVLIELVAPLHEQCRCRPSTLGLTRFALRASASFSASATLRFEDTPP